MNPRTHKRLLKINKILEDKNQNIRFVCVDTNGWVLSNGEILDKSEIGCFCKRLESPNYCEKMDVIYGINKTESQRELASIKTLLCSYAGKAAWEKSREKICRNMKNRTPWNKGKKSSVPAWNRGLTKETHPSLTLLSENRMGDKNPMWGIHPTQSQRDKQSTAMKKLIKDGKFTPNIHNSLTHTRIQYKGKKYRSSWEAAFQAINPKYEYEIVRLDYYDPEKKKNRIYITDFVCHNNKEIVEIKPKSKTSSKQFLAKTSAAKSWCIENGYVFILIDEEYFSDNIEKIRNILDFDRLCLDRLERSINAFNKKNRN